MATIRRATNFDIQKIQTCNLMNLPENYQLKYFIQHTLSTPELTQVAEYEGQIVGQVMTKVDEEQVTTNKKTETIQVGHITSVSVLREYRKLNIARKLMMQSMRNMKLVQMPTQCTLHCRASNRAGFSLYSSLGFKIHVTDQNQQADMEDAQDMRYYFNQSDEKDEVFHPSKYISEQTIDVDSFFN